MIEFKGNYYQKGDVNPQSVLVQFDGVLLHVWHMSDPFHRLLTSDVFRLPTSMSRRRRCIKLPNGGWIETDDLKALGTLLTDTISMADHNDQSQYLKVLVAGSVLLLLAGGCLLARYILGT